MLKEKKILTNFYNILPIFSVFEMDAGIILLSSLSPPSFSFPLKLDSKKLFRNGCALRVYLSTRNSPALRLIGLSRE